MALAANGFELLRQLREKKTNDALRYDKLKEFFGMKARKKGIPMFGDFELTPLCNFDCKMCYVHLDADQLHGQSVLPVETWKDLIHQAWEAGMLSANLSGGECLTYPGFEELFLYLHSLGCEVGVLTNGLLLDDQRIQFFREHSPSSIQITLYGWNDDVYERVTGRRVFSTVVNNIKRAIAADLPVRISITPSSYLGEDIFETIRTARQICESVMINSTYTSPREETGRAGLQGDAELELYIRAYKYVDRLDGYETSEIDEKDLPPCGGSCHESAGCGLRCGGGRSNFAIDWRGMLKPCIEMDMVQGFPLRDGFAEAWAKVNREANSWPRVPECEDCAYAGVCNSCAANMLKYAAPGKQPFELCRQTRELVRNGVKRIPECE